MHSCVTGVSQQDQLDTAIAGAKDPGANTSGNEESLTKVHGHVRECGGCLCVFVCLFAAHAAEKKITREREKA